MCEHYSFELLELLAIYTHKSSALRSENDIARAASLIAAIQKFLAHGPFRIRFIPGVP